METTQRNAMTAAKPKTVYRWVPCPLYDIEALESWLGEMAQNGYCLCRDGFWGPLVRFEKTEPCTMRYRLDAAPGRYSIFEDAPHPTEEELEIAAAAGWQYMGRRSFFYVYCTAEPQALELNTDPRVQALSLDQLRKSTTSNFFLHLFILLTNGWRLLGMPLLTMIELGMTMGTLTLLSLFWYVTDTALDVVHLRRMQRKLRLGTPLNHSKNWRSARRTHLARCGLNAISLVWVALLLYASADENSFGRQRIPMEQYTEPLPFVTIADYRPDSSYESQGLSFGKYNTLTRKSGLLASDFIDLWEYGTLTTPDGERLQGFLLVRYYELPNEALAQQVARELEWMDRSDLAVKHKDLSLPEGLDADYAKAYTDVFPTAVLRQGCRVAQYTVSLHWRDENGEQAKAVPLEEWAIWAAAGLAAD